MTSVGEWTTPTLKINPYDGTTAAALTIAPPTGAFVVVTPTLLGELPEGAVTYQVWQGSRYQLTAAGPWEERWTVTGVGAGPQTNIIMVSGAAAPGRAGSAYATPQQYADLIGGTIPSDILLRLHNATCDIDNALMSSVYDASDAAVAAALARACVQQAAAVKAAGADGDGGAIAPGVIAAKSAGNVSITYGDPNSLGRAGPAGLWVDGLCPKAWAELARIGLTGGRPASSFTGWVTP